MATSVRIKLNSKGIAALLKGPEIQADLRRRANAVAQSAGGEGFEATVITGGDRAAAFIRTATHEARMAEAKNRALTQALDAGR